ncbi:hypothetical protein [Nocardia harenae]|uniref:hypothetical protein n=1 Tax=Nocardia harenae TaxID=358707 RepID=UPI0008327860|nr:hypothetical protein [Nocardia harenae]
MTPGPDLDRIAAESTRRAAAVLDELTAANAATARTATDLATRSARAVEALERRHRPRGESELDQAPGEPPPEAASLGDPYRQPPGSLGPPPGPHVPGTGQPGTTPESGGRHAAPDPDENTRPLWRAPGPDDADAGTAPLPVITAREQGEQERRREELQERRDAIARSIAARRAQSVARPSDQDDEEGEYYRRTSWLI